MQEPPQKRSAAQQIALFSFTMAIYLTVVHAWSLHLPPGPRDMSLFARTDVPFGPLMRWQVAWMGDAVWLWRVQAMLLLYGCMLAIFFLTRHTVGRPWWLGSLAAVLFMAHPAKSEAVLDLGGMLDLLAALLALGTLALYAAHLRTQRLSLFAMALPLLLVTMLLFPAMLSVYLVVVLMELLLPETDVPGAGRRKLLRMALCLGVFLAALGFWQGLEFVWSPAVLFAPLYTTVYPTGLLPQTVETYQAHPWLGWMVGALAVLAFTALYRAVRHPALLWGGTAALAARLLQVQPEVDPVTLAGGGSLLLPIALAHVAWAAVCHRIFSHPHWTRPIVYLTTVWCALYFILQVQVILQWR